MQDFTDSSPYGQAELAPRKKSRTFMWVLCVIAGVGVLGCGGCFSFLVYLGTVGPETSVYTGNRIPARFIDTVEEVGALEQGEKILFFYSDGMTDIRDGFYFVSDRRVVLYSQNTGDSALTSVPFGEIVHAEIFRNESFFEDSEITLQLREGEILSFPVSSELDRDQEFFDAIEQRISGMTAEREQ